MENRMIKRVLYEDLAWPDIKAMWDENKIIVQTVGAIEQHGPHLPFNTDDIRVIEVAKRGCALAQERGVKAFVAPPIHWGFSTLQMDLPGDVDRYPGTLTLSAETLMQVVLEVAQCFARANCNRMLLLNGHGGNWQPLQTVARTIRDKTGMMVAVANALRLPPVGSLEGLLKEQQVKHAGEYETATILAIDENLVRMNEVKRDQGAVEGIKVRSRFVSRNELGGEQFSKPVMVAERNVDFSSQGVVGDPSPATKAQGEKIMEVLTDSLVNFLEEFIGWEYGKM
jgi:creatinine amidohydrolase